MLKLVDKSGNMRSLQGCEEMELHKANIYNETKLCLEIEDDKSDPWGALVSDIEMETYNPNITDIENEELQKAMEYSLRDYQQDSEKANTNSTGMDLKRENRRISPQCDGS